METEGSLLCSQELAPGAYPKPDVSTPHLHTFLLLRSAPVLAFHLFLGFPSGRFRERFSVQKFVYISYLSHAYYIPRPSHPNNMWWRVQVIKLLLMQLCPTSGYFQIFSSLPCSQIQILRRLVRFLGWEIGLSQGQYNIKKRRKIGDTVLSNKTDRFQWGLYFVWYDKFVYDEPFLRKLLTLQFWFHVNWGLYWSR